MALMVITDGRTECLAATLDALARQVDPGLFDRSIIVDDSGDERHGAWIDSWFNFSEHVRCLAKAGFAGAIQAGWDHVGDVDWVFHLEDDFVIERPVDLEAIVDTLREHPQLVQVALRRQAWGPEEVAAGGYVEMHPDAYVERQSGHLYWLEHRLFFTTNPSVYRTSLTRGGWPQMARSEGEFSRRVFEQPDVVAGIWGRRDDVPLVTHIGRERVGGGY